MPHVFSHQTHLVTSAKPLREQPLTLKSTQERQFKRDCPNFKVPYGPIALEPGDHYLFSTWIGFIGFCLFVLRFVCFLGTGGYHFKMALFPLSIGQFKPVIRLLLQSGAVKEEMVKSASWTTSARRPWGK